MKLKFGIIGTGSRGIDCFGKLLAKREDCEIKGLFDPNPVRMQVAAETLNIPELTCYNNLEEMFGNEKLDACVITSPDCFHADNSIQAMQSGVNVLIDKPLATNYEDCMRIIDAADKSGKLAMIGFNMRHNPVLKQVKSLIDDGYIGKIFMIENREFYSNGKTYMSRWNRHYEQSGGLWIHKGSHDFDIFNWLLDFPEPVVVSAFAGISVMRPAALPFKVEDGIPVGPDCFSCSYQESCPDVKIHGDKPQWGTKANEADGYRKDLCMYMSDKNVHDNGFAMIEYENGVRACHMECFVTGLSDRRYTIIGNLGQLEVSIHKRTVTFRPRWNGETVTYTIPQIEGGHGGADPGLVDCFINSIKNKKPVDSTLQHGALSSIIGQAAEISWREKRTVKIEDIKTAVKRY